jgi:predicted hydrocarbon binding protein
MGDTQSQPTDWVQQLIRDYQDTLTCGLYEAIYKLDDRAVETLMRAQGRTCAGAFLKLSDLHGPMALDDFLKVMRIAAPSKIEIRRDGDVIEWVEQHQGECVCPFVRRKVVRLDSKLCICGAQWVQHLFEAVANTRVEVETVETVATGAENCHYRVRVKGTYP